MTRNHAAATKRRPVAIGGLMRCCLETHHKYEGPEDEGTVHGCQWCKSTMVVKDGVWRWNHD